MSSLLALAALAAATSMGLGAGFMRNMRLRSSNRSHTSSADKKASFSPFADMKISKALKQCYDLRIAAKTQSGQRQRGIPGGRASGKVVRVAWGSPPGCLFSRVGRAAHGWMFRK